MKLKIIHILYTTTTGGAEKMVLELIKRADRTRFDIALCCLTDKGDMAVDFEALSIPIFYLHKKDKFDIGVIFKLAQIFKKEHADIVHTHDSSTILYGTLAAKMAGVKRIINTEHGGVYFETPKKQFFSRLLWRLNSKIVCVSESITRDLIARGLCKNKALVIPNGINISRFDVAVDKKIIRKELGLADTDFVICAIGRLSQEKNQQLLISAVPAILEKIPQAKVVLAGDGPLRSELEALAKKTGVTQKVVFLGTRTDVPRILKISDCFALTSNYESFGLAVVEAMAAGVPVVATDAGGVRELVVNNETGILIVKNDADALVKALIKIQDNADFRKQVAAEAKNFVCNNYDIEKMVTNYEALYARI